MSDKKIIFPKQLIKENLDGKVLEKLNEKHCIIEGIDKESSIPSLELTPALRTNIFYAYASKNASIGMENIEKEMQREQGGIIKNVNQSERVSRLLIVSNDGSERFYRQLPFLQKMHGGRLLVVFLNINSEAFGKVLGLKEKKIKSLLVNHKDSVVQILKSILV
ncbi:MAG: hypothetical protein ACRC37_05550 [Lentisphaeria bacterium]